MASTGVAPKQVPLPQPAPPPLETPIVVWRADALCLVALCVVTLLTWIPRWSGPLDMRWDGGTYFILGTSLAEGKGYRLLNEPGEIRADQYPPLLPVIVAAHEKALRSTDPVRVGVTMRHTWVLISVAYILVAFLLARAFVGPWHAFWLATVCALSFDMYYLSTLCFTELPFALAAGLFGWLYLRQGGTSWTRYFAPVFAIAAYLLRTLGITLLAAWVADALLKRQFRCAIIRAGIALVPVLAWQTYVHSVESSPEYKHPAYAYQRDPSMFYNVSYSVNMKLKDPFQPDLGNASIGDFVYRFTHNALALPSTLGQSITARQGFYKSHVNLINRSLGRNLIPHWTYKVFLNLMGAVVLFGLLRLALRRQWLVACAVVFTVGAVCTTPWPGQFARYLAPMLPFLLLAVVAAGSSEPVKVAYASGSVSGIPDTGNVNSKPEYGRKPVATLVLVIGIPALIFLECVIVFWSGNRNFLDTAYYRDAHGVTKPYHVVHYSGEYPEAAAALHWLVQRAEPNAVVALAMPQWAYLESGLKAVMPPLTRDPEKAQRLIDTVPVSYVLVEKLLMNDDFNFFFPQLVKHSSDKWKLVYARPGSPVQLYGRVGIARLSGVVLGK